MKSLALEFLTTISRSGLALCAGLGVSGALFGQGGGGGTTPPQPPPPGYHEPGPGVTVKESAVSRGDRKFLEKAAASGVKEVAVSKAVLPRATTPGVRALAEMMITDHTAANDELKTLAKKKFVTLPPETDADHHAKKWGERSDDVEKDYVKEMVSDHEDAVKRFEKATESDDTEIAAFARKTLPKLKHHLEQAKALEKAR